MIRQKIYFLLLIVLLNLFAFSSTSVFATDNTLEFSVPYAITDGKIELLENGTAKLIYFPNLKGEDYEKYPSKMIPIQRHISIPEYLEGYLITAIGDEALSEEVRRVTIPASIIDIDIRAFVNCSNLQGFIVDDSNPFYKSNNGILYSKDMSVLVAFPAKNNNYVLQPSKRITIPETVKKIGSYAFYGCSDTVAHIWINDNATIEEVGDHSFDKCEGIFSIKGNTILKEALRKAGIQYLSISTDEEMEEIRNRQLKERVFIMAVVSIIIVLTTVIIIILHREDIVFPNGKKHKPWLIGLLIGTGLRIYISSFLGFVICLSSCVLSFCQYYPNKSKSIIYIVHILAVLHSVFFVITFSDPPYAALLLPILLVIIETGVVKEYKEQSPFDINTLFSDSSSMCFATATFFLSSYCSLIITSHPDYYFNIDLNIKSFLLSLLLTELLSLSPYVHIVWLGVVVFLLIVGIIMDIVVWKLWSIPRTIVRFVVYVLFTCIEILISLINIF